VSSALRAGRHTTSSTTLFRLADDAWLVDSPGMSVFGLAHYPGDVLEHAFVELRGIAQECRFRDCRHDREPDCAVQEAVAAGKLAPQRVELLRNLVAESQAARDPAR
jgi:ribosome biogenesis GTPase